MKEIDLGGIKWRLEDDLKRINKNLQEQLGKLKLLRNDTLREKEGIQLLSTIDYNSIYTYIHKGRYQYGIIRSILKEPEQKFILLPGAIRELLNDIGFTAKGFQSWIKELQFGKIERLDEIKRFIDGFEKEDDPIKIIALYEDMLKKLPLIKFLQGRFLIESGLKRLRDLIEKGVLISSDDMGIDLRDVSINSDIYNRIFNDLNKLRLYKALSNKTDTQNFVLTYALNEKYKNEKYFTILTDSHIPIMVYKNIDWENDPLKTKYPDEKFPIFRGAFEHWKLIRIKGWYPDISEREEYLKRGIELARRNIELLPFIPEYKRTQDEIEKERECLRKLKKQHQLSIEDLEIITKRIGSYYDEIEDIKRAIAQGQKGVSESIKTVERIGGIGRFNFESFRTFERDYSQKLGFTQQKIGMIEIEREEIMRRIRELVYEISNKETLLNTLKDSYKDILNEIKNLWETLKKFRSQYIFDKDMEDEFHKIEDLLKKEGIIK